MSFISPESEMHSCTIVLLYRSQNRPAIPLDVWLLSDMLEYIRYFGWDGMKEHLTQFMIVMGLVLRYILDLFVYTPT